ncbi:MAG: hypothetical protein H0V07_04250 [Propionibacteriales bacterium]|nr:hypothetical protein [Propionibacteriales bacterium]
MANAQPLLILLPALWLYGERVSLRTGVALALGLSGLLVVAVPGAAGRVHCCRSAASAVTAGTLMVRYLGGVDVVVASAAHFLVGGLGPGIGCRPGRGCPAH